MLPKPLPVRHALRRQSATFRYDDAFAPTVLMSPLTFREVGYLSRLEAYVCSSTSEGLPPALMPLRHVIRIHTRLPLISGSTAYCRHGTTSSAASSTPASGGEIPPARWIRLDQRRLAQTVDVLSKAPSADDECDVRAC